MQNQGKAPFNTVTSQATSLSSNTAILLTQSEQVGSQDVTRLQNQAAMPVSGLREQSIQYRPTGSVKHIPTGTKDTAGYPYTVQQSETYLRKMIKLRLIARFKQTHQIPINQLGLGINAAQLPSDQPNKTVVRNPAMVPQIQSINNKFTKDQQVTEARQPFQVTSKQATSKQHFLHKVQPVGSPKCIDLSASQARPRITSSQVISTSNQGMWHTSEPQMQVRFGNAQMPNIRPPVVKQLLKQSAGALKQELVSGQSKPIQKLTNPIQTSSLKTNPLTKKLAQRIQNALLPERSILKTTQPPTNITNKIPIQQPKSSTISSAHIIQTTSGLTATANVQPQVVSHHANIPQSVNCQQVTVPFSLSFQPATSSCLKPVITALPKIQQKHDSRIKNDDNQEQVLSDYAIKHDMMIQHVNIMKRTMSNTTDESEPLAKNKKTEEEVNSESNDVDKNTLSTKQSVEYLDATRMQAVPCKHARHNDVKETASELNLFLERIDENVLECHICFKRLKNPKSLNCLHSYCLACLEDWVKVKGKLTCPTCSKLYPIPEGGIEKLPPNTFLNNLLETMERFSKKDGMKCVCGNKKETKSYCQDCKQCLCSACSDHHKKFRLFSNHKLHLVDDMRSMSPSQIASLHPALCSIHNEPLQFFCCVCRVPICMYCTIIEHKEWEGNHKSISISEAFQTFKESSAVLEKAAHQLKQKLHDGIKAVSQNVTDLEQNKDTSLKDIDNYVQEITEKINENIKEKGQEMKNKVKAIYRKKKEVLDKQMNELKTTISDINTKLSFLNQLIKSDEATAVQSSESVIRSLTDRINESPKSEPKENGNIKFIKKELELLKTCNIGKIDLKLKDCLTDKKEHEIIKRKTTDDSAENEGLVNNIKIDIRIQDVAESVDCFLVSCWTNVIYKYNQSGEHIGKITLPKGVKVNKMYRMMNGNIIFSEYLKHITVCNVNGQIIKSIGEGLLKDPTGIYVDETSSVVYVGEWNISCVLMFDINSGQLIRRIGSKGNLEGQMNGVEDVALTNLGHLLVLEYYNNRVQLFDNKGKFIKVFVEEGNENGMVRSPRGVAVDADNNIIISSKNKLQLFSSDGNFIKRIDNEEDGLNNPLGLCIISRHPRRVAVTNPNDHTVKLFNY